MNNGKFSGIRELATQSQGYREGGTGQVPGDLLLCVSHLLASCDQPSPFRLYSFQGPLIPGTDARGSPSSSALSPSPTCE